MKTAVRQRAFLTGRHHQVFAAFATVRAGIADIDNPLEPHVVDGAEPFGDCSITTGPFVKSMIARL
jgi:hypothetical protein